MKNIQKNYIAPVAAFLPADLQDMLCASIEDFGSNPIELDEMFF